MSESPKSIAQHYHERTKYDPETLGLKSQTLDWEKQPILLKSIKSAQSLTLNPTYGTPTNPPLVILKSDFGSVYPIYCCIVMV